MSDLRQRAIDAVYAAEVGVDEISTAFVVDALIAAGLIAEPITDERIDRAFNRAVIRALVSRGLNLIAAALVAIAAGAPAAEAASAPRVTPAQARVAVESWTSWYWSAEHIDDGSGVDYSVEAWHGSCHRTPARMIRCQAAYYVLDPTDTYANIGAFEDFWRVCRPRRVARARHAVATPDGRVPYATIRIRKGVVLDCRWLSYHEDSL